MLLFLDNLDERLANIVDGDEEDVTWFGQFKQ